MVVDEQLGSSVERLDERLLAVVGVEAASFSTTGRLAALPRWASPSSCALRG
jgi:hypothetical protein